MSVRPIRRKEVHCNLRGVAVVCVCVGGGEGYAKVRGVRLNAGKMPH